MGRGGRSSKLIAAARTLRCATPLALAFAIQGLPVLADPPSNAPPSIEALQAAVERDKAAGDFQAEARDAQAAVTALAAAQGPDSPNLALASVALGSALEQLGRYPESESAYRRALAILEKAVGPDQPVVASLLGAIASVVQDQGRYGEAEAADRQALTIREKAGDPTHLAAGLNNLALVLEDEGRYREAEPLLRRAVAIWDTSPGSGGRDLASGLDNLAGVLEAQGDSDQAEPLYRRGLEIREALSGPDSDDVATSLNNLGELLSNEGRTAEAEPLYRRALAIREKRFGPDHPLVATSLNSLAYLLENENRDAEAEPLLRRAQAIWQKSLPPNHPLLITVRNNLATALDDQGRHAEAQPLYRLNLEAAEAILGQDDRGLALPLNNLALTLDTQGRHDDAEPLLVRALTIDTQALGPDHPETVTARINLAFNLAAQDKYAAAVEAFRPSCANLAGSARRATASRAASKVARGGESQCSGFLTLALWSWAAAGGGPQPADKPAALSIEAFDWAQRAVGSAAGEAMSRSAALSAAAAGGAGSLAREFEDDLVALDRLNGEFADAAGAAGGSERQADLARERDETAARITALESQLRAKYPLYWDYRSPSPLGVSALQAPSGPDAALLKPNEAVVLWMVAPGADHGLVFAASKAGFAWARMGMSGDEIANLVKAMRRQLDPQAIGAVSGADLAAAGSGGMTEGAASGAPATPPAPAGFDREGAFRLYQALLGDPGILKVLHGPGIDTLLVVPSGPLTSLPPAVLSTGKPGDPAAHWLIEDYALAVLPQVSALRTLRQLLPASRGAAPSKPLLAFADPDFAGVGAVPGVFPGRDPYVLTSGRTTTGADRGAPSASAAERDGRSRAEILASLPPLWDTRAEGVELMTLLGADHADLLLGPAATKTALMDRQADHSLSAVKVLDFSTHGLITGDFAGLTEPALVLAAPPAGTDPATDDQLLRASEAAGLTLTADWVVLSACNTAAGETPGADGLSGLARAFFHAGAKSLLVSHWRVQSDATERLITTTFKGYRDGAPSKAKALQQAMTAMIKDPAASNPSLWGPFVIVGEPR